MSLKKRYRSLWALFLLLKSPFNVHSQVFSEKILSSADSLTNKKSQEDSIKLFELSEFVVTATRTFKHKTESPIRVNVLDDKALSNLQACNLAEGLRFQPGLRVEANCQTCHYTQLRMNGLQGSYTQILWNGRPIFSPLLGLYGLEQLPMNMIERIEVIRGGASSLYGSNAVGGTVNIITKMPRESSYELNSFYQLIGKKAKDFHLNTNATIVNKQQNKGMTFYANKRNRDFFDANRDNFSELPKLENRSWGLSSFYKFDDKQKLEFSLSYLSEYRMGGEMVQKPAFLMQQAEERKHKIWLASADYQVYFHQRRSSLVVFSALQHARRSHYTGIFPEEEIKIIEHIQNPPYGVSQTHMFQAGFQLNHEFRSNLGKKILTIGSEYLFDKILDNIPKYNYRVNQNTKNLGIFGQIDWEITNKINFLSGFRVDKHNLLHRWILSPRLAILYEHLPNLQYRISYGKGFRAPQAFDTDLHIAFAGGGVSRVQISPFLKEETSQSWSASLNYDKPTSKWIAGITFEGFYTTLRNAFVLENVGNDEFGELFEKRNGQGADVFGCNFEGRFNYNKLFQLEGGLTAQKSYYQKPVVYIEGFQTTTFLRTPNLYGYTNLNFRFSKWNYNLNYVYTGRMLIAHFGGAENFSNDAIVRTRSFSDLNVKMAYDVSLKKIKQVVELYAGIKNALNAYQHDFDIGKNRDSNYIYGTLFPRTFYIGMKIKNG
ncbi:MAG: TonB-dependent receptor [Cytophagales bacterium]|nr:TonB-dependent receptor [Cytophagales bacterium]MDW8384081.1 TonB-dependent receptor [Flammeovirgaceae bacterium]